MTIIILYIVHSCQPRHDRSFTMRYPPEHKEETRTRIVNAAAKAFRKHGLDGVGVAQLMKGAKLTHGGFYAHFKSKDALIVDAIDAAFDQMTARLEAIVSEAPADQRRRAVLDAYMTQRHRDHPEAGCAIPALGADVARLDATTRHAFAAGITSLIELIADKGKDKESRAAAITTLAAMVGGMVLARSVRSDALSQEILDAVRNMG
ncbi:TetR/AcrR family transcriptional regulator [Paraburkholderia sediminicola]|uniref:TetR/AcrR family transcriptional regulator n=1 Tax=Paraburkholderia sediminicola TaxID=458836 RepID=UPI0038BA991E